MNVEQDKTAFQPVLIKIETNAELLTLKIAIHKYALEGTIEAYRQICIDLHNQLHPLS